MIRYDISPLDPEAHLFIVAIRLSQFSTHEQLFRLPNWINGSYLIRDFAAHIQKVRAFINKHSCSIKKVSKDTWAVSTGRKSGELTLIYEVHAFDTSVRGAYLDSCRGFFNPGAVFMRVIGQDNQPVQVNITSCDSELNSSSLTWKVGTSLPRAEGTECFGWGLYTASNYDNLLDYPVELSDFMTLSFTLRGAKHSVIINSTPANFDSKRFLKDIKRICDYEICFFDPNTKKCPVSEYVFLLNVTSNNYGGLEHQSSSALCAPARSLPCTHTKEATKDYISLLGLFAHEYFHTWFVKRIKPAEFVSMDFSAEIPSTLLWLFEGFTNYYDDLILRRCKLISDNQYADLLSENFKAYLETPARHIQTLAESSFDAWIKFYKPTPNSVNNSISYYKQGALCALALDLYIRSETKQKASLDSFMRMLWSKYISEPSSYVGIKEEDLAALFQEASGVNCQKLLYQLTQTTKQFDFDKLLRPLGGNFSNAPLPLERKLLGVDGKITDGGFLVRHVYDGEAGQWAGISPGDTLIAIDGTRLTSETFSTLLSRYDKGDEMVIHAFRDDSMLVWTILIGQPTEIPSILSFEGASTLREAWLD